MEKRPIRLFSAHLGDPILLDLGGRGVRSIEYVETEKLYLISAGPPGDVGSFALFRWRGPGTQELVEIELSPLKDLNVEALAFLSGNSKILALSDDGGALVDGKECKEAPLNQRSFRGRWIMAK
jgi:hypothetical protein